MRVSNVGCDSLAKHIPVKLADPSVDCSAMASAAEISSLCARALSTSMTTGLGLGLDTSSQSGKCLLVCRRFGELEKGSRR